MITDPKYFITPFAASGTRLAVPGTVQPDGSVSYPAGFGADYAKELGVDPDAKAMPRDSFNEIIYETQNSLAALQQFAYPQWISAAMNGGSAYSYLKKARVHYTADAGATWETYESLIDSNTATPGSDATKWAVVPSTGTVTIPTINSAGTANAITGTFIPAVTSLASPFMVLVRAGAANSSSTPTFNANGTGAQTIYKGNNQNLANGDIVGAGHWMLLMNDPTLTKWQLLNPGISTYAPNTALDYLTITGTNIASAGTTNIAAAAGESVTITGTTTITAFGTASAGVKRILTFSGALTLTHNATSLILPGAANITTTAGDSAIMLSLGSGNWKCINYQQNVVPFVLPQRFIDPTGIAYTADGSTYQIAHGLGARPFMFTIYAKCTTAEHNFSIGQTVELSSYTDNGPGGDSDKGCNIRSDATYLYIDIGVSGLYFFDRTAHTIQLLTPGKWTFFGNATL